ncbi:MAG: carbohydrate ABC transporter permease [Clostridiales bacterium]|nr:carbohydrate ABC transporter permease [Clostridiales bacterium]
MESTALKKLEPSKPKIWSVSQVVLILVLALFVLICVLPVLNVAAISLSGKSAILQGRVTFWPVDFSTNAYIAIFRDSSMIYCMFYTIFLTVVYTLIAIVSTVLLAYPLTKKRLHGRKILSALIIFTMYFSGGTIPTYLTIKNYGLINTMWSLIFPAMISTYNMIILRSFISALPGELEEAAIIDGADDFQVLFRVILPLSLPAVTTISLFYAVGKWNSFSDALYYISTTRLQPLQLRLYNIIKGAQSVEISLIEGSSSTDFGYSITESIESASIIFATLPILLVYPFVQRYFVSGVTVGAVKG